MPVELPPPRNTLYRRRTRSSRRLTPQRLFLYRLGAPVAELVIRGWWAMTRVTRVLGDGWTAVTRDGSLAAHFEHTVAVTSAGPLVLTARPVRSEKSEVRS